MKFNPSNSPHRGIAQLASSRRAFLKTAVGAGLALPFLGKSLAAWEYSSSDFIFTKMGVNAGLDQAEAVHKAGAEYLLIPTKVFLRPDKSVTEFEKQLALLEKSPIPVLSCNSFLIGDELRSVGPDAKIDNVLRFAETAFSRANRAGVKFIVFGSAGSRKKPDGWSKEQVDGEFIALLKQLGPMAQAQGVTVVVENLNSNECNYLTRIGEVGEIVTQVDHPNVQMLADLFHASVMDDPAEDIAKYAHLIKMVEIAEKVGRTAPGVGGQDFTPYFDALKKGGYRGPIEIEGSWEVEQLPKAFETVRRQAS